MTYINWILRAALFIVLLGFAMKNDQPVTLHFFFGHEWQSSLVIVAFIFFAAGAVVGVLSMLLNVLKLRHEIARLKREIKAKAKLADAGEMPQKPALPE